LEEIYLFSLPIKVRKKIMQRYSGRMKQKC
jgi:hypothetical protein